MLDYLGQHRAAFYAKCEYKLAEYGQRLVQAAADGTDEGCWVERILSLSTGLDVVKESLPADAARTGRIIAFVVDYHELDTAALVPFQSVPVTIVLPGGAGGNPYFADILGDPAANPALVLYIQQQIAAIGPVEPVFDADFTVQLTNNKTFGKYLNGQVVPATGKTARQLLVDIATEFLPPSFTAFAVDGQGSRTVEAGTFIAGSSKTFTWATSNPGNVTPNSITIQNLSTGQTLASGEANDGSAVADVSNYTANLGTTRIYQIAATNTNSGTFSALITITPAPRLYYGPSAAPVTTRTAALALGNSVLTLGAGGGTLNTGTTLTAQEILLPPGRNLLSVVNQDAQNLDITGEYLNAGTVSIADAGSGSITYTRMRRTQGVPYTVNQRHNFTYS